MYWGRVLIVLMAIMAAGKAGANEELRRQVEPSVVRIEVKFRRDSSAFEGISAQDIREDDRTSQGTGFVFTRGGRLFTARHVVLPPREGSRRTRDLRYQDIESITVWVGPHQSPEKGLRAACLREGESCNDQKLDVAVLEILNSEPWKPWRPIAFATSAPDRSEVTVFGFAPVRDETKVLGREAKIQSSTTDMGSTEIRPSAEPGFSGGPVVDQRGLVVGIYQKGIEHRGRGFYRPQSQLDGLRKEYAESDDWQDWLLATLPAPGTAGWILATLSLSLALPGLLYIILAKLAARRFFRNNRLGVAAVYVTQERAQRRIQALAQSAKQIDVLAVRALGIVGLKDSLVRKSVGTQSKAQVRVLALDPSSGFGAVRAREIGEAEATFASSLVAGLNGVAEFRSQSGARVELRLYDALPVWRIIRLDDTMFISSFADGIEGHNTVVYEVRDGPDQSLFKTWLRHFDHLWDSAKVVRSTDDVRSGVQVSTSGLGSVQTLP